MPNIQDNKDKKEYIKLNDYKLFDYEIPNIFLNFIIEDEIVIVKTELKLIKKNIKTNTLILDGIDIFVKKIYLDENQLENKYYSIKNNSLVIKSIIKETFTIKIEGIIKPKENVSLLGMYESNGIITTQCEAEGFRRISYHSDRPDILSKYKVRIEANKKDFPVLLSNGNLIKANDLDDKRHEVIWVDPYPKPSYLFALVAGKLNVIRDSFITKSNKKVKINIYVEKGDEKYVQHSINSLKKSMKWDEEKYNLEYDLSLFNIVAIRHFNMGAMENKSLNIFNSKLILANSETTTDAELERIEGVVAHEYFHNWTGNRITCRDWFQLSLKEGLTVFRDQEFTADLHNRSIKRLEDAKYLRKSQFREDSGPTSHSVRPEKYLEIDNFYTTTIYEKGAEIIRMLKTLVKEENFNIGFKNFISDYDGKAATIDQFVEKILENNKEINIEKFKIWYKQNGTPLLKFKREWDKENKVLKIKASQDNPNKNTPYNDLPLIIPINIAIYLSNYEKIYKTFILKEKEEEFILENIQTNFDNPIITYFREFSAPIKWETDNTFDEKLLILEFETDCFTIYDTIKGIYKEIIFKRIYKKADLNIEKKLIFTLRSIIINNKTINLSLLSEILNIPNFTEIESEIKNIDPLRIYKTIDELNYLFGTKLQDVLLNKLNEIEKNITKTWPEGKDDRKLIETIWKLLLHSNNKKIKSEIMNYVNSNSMTLSKAALNVFTRINCPERELISNMFFKKWKTNRVVLDNWFFFKASIEEDNNQQSIEDLFNNKYFDVKSPNTLRSVLSGYVTRNSLFHSVDGSGYKYVAKKIVEFDKLNPIVISRFLKIFSTFQNYKEPYRSNIFKVLNFINDNDLSPNTREVIETILN